MEIVLGAAITLQSPRPHFDVWNRDYEGFVCCSTPFVEKGTSLPLLRSLAAVGAGAEPGRGADRQ